MKLLLDCTKAKPYLADFKGEYQTYSNGKELDELWDKGFNANDIMNILNGKIVAECDFEVEEIRYVEYADEWGYETNTLNEDDLIDKSCLSGLQLNNYLRHCKNGAYAIHIKNLNIFDEPKELSEYGTWVQPLFLNEGELALKRLEKAPQNMMYAYDEKGNKYVVISIQSQWMCLILNRIKDVEVRRVVLKEMLKNEKRT